MHWWLQLSNLCIFALHHPFCEYYMRGSVVRIEKVVMIDSAGTQ